jgi:hypothetical protein
MEACATWHYRARGRAKFGHTVKLMPPACSVPNSSKPISTKWSARCGARTAFAKASEPRQIKALLEFIAFKGACRLDETPDCLFSVAVRPERSAHAIMHLRPGGVFIWLYRRFPRILDAITIVRPETVVRWHRMGFAAYWRRKSRPRGGRPRIGKETCATPIRPSHVSANAPTTVANGLSDRPATLVRLYARRSISGVRPHGRSPRPQIP